MDEKKALEDKIKASTSEEEILKDPAMKDWAEKLKKIEETQKEDLENEKNKNQGPSSDEDKSDAKNAAAD